MRRAVVFDLDGTLADTAPDIMATLNHLLAAEGLPVLPVEAAASLVGSGARVLLQKGFAAAGQPLSEERLEQLFQAFLAHYAEHLCVGSRLYPGVRPALDALLADGHVLAICTNKPQFHARRLVEALGVAPAFRFVAGRDSFAFCKPDPRHLTQTLAEIGAEPAEAVLVGDSHTDVATARAAGVPVIGVSFGYTETPMRLLGPDRLIDHFDGLVAAVRDLADGEAV